MQNIKLIFLTEIILFNCDKVLQLRWCWQALTDVTNWLFYVLFAGVETPIALVWQQNMEK